MNKNYEHYKQQLTIAYNSPSTSLLSSLNKSGAIGRRYRRMDEVGTPYCITVDFETLEDDTVTIRSRDTTEQRRIHVKDLFKLLSKEVDGFDEDED
jgi:glycyl-tRNA synthetase